MKKTGKKIKNPKKKGKMLSLFSGISGGLSFLGGWQICHNLCLGIVAVLSLIGITIVGMPLLFLTRYALYFWLAAVLILMPTLIMYWKNRKFMSKNLIMLNIGIIIAATPFNSLQPYQLLFRIAGGALVVASVVLFLRNRFKPLE